MDWHPADKTEANVQPSLALVDFMVEFSGQSAHASVDPWNARAANDAGGFLALPSMLKMK